MTIYKVLGSNDDTIVVGFLNAQVGKVLSHRFMPNK